MTARPKSFYAIRRSAMHRAKEAVYADTSLTWQQAWAKLDRISDAYKRRENLVALRGALRCEGVELNEIHSSEEAA